MLGACVALVACSMNHSPSQSTESYEVARERMVTEQIAARGIRDPRVLEAMSSVPRHELVPEALRDRAYTDTALPIGRGQTISQPYIVALMTEFLRVSEGDKVLEVGTGSGYQSAVLAQMGADVYTIEIVPELAEQARADLERLGYAGVQFRTGDGYRGWEEEAPFAAIIVTAAPDHVPEPLVEQLAVGGRMILPVGRWYQELMLITRDEKNVNRQELIGVRFVPMRGEAER